MSEMFPISGSNLYQRWLAERDEIARHKWFMSEKMGYDCGWEYARWDWNMRFRSEWLKKITKKGASIPSTESD